MAGGLMHGVRGWLRRAQGRQAARVSSSRARSAPPLAAALLALLLSLGLTMGAQAQTGPAAPTNFTATAEGFLTVIFSWDNPSNDDITGYEYRESISTPLKWGEGDWREVPGSIEYPDADSFSRYSGFTAGAEYSFQIRAVAGENQEIKGAASEIATATPTALPSVSLSVSGSGVITEGGSALTITATRSEANTSGAPLVIPIRVRTDDTTAQANDYTVATSISIANNATTGTATFAVTNDTADEPPETVVIELGTLPADTAAGSPSEVTIAIADNDATTVTLSGAAGDIAEGATKTFMVTLNRGLVNGEALPVPLTFGGGATQGTDYTTACPTSLPTGVTCANLNTGNPTVTFTGPTNGATATQVTLTLAAATDSTAEPGGETVDIGLGTLNANSGTGLGGGARGTDTLAAFRINDAPVPVDPTAPSVSISGGSGVTEGAAASFTLTVAPAPAVALSVTVTVADDATSDFLESDDEGTRTVTVTTSGTATFMVATTRDDMDEANGQVTASVAAGAGYTVGSPASATVTVADDDATTPALADDDTVTPALAFAPRTVTVAEGGKAAYTVALASEPTGTVTVRVEGASGEVTFDTDAGTDGDQRTLTFDASNWRAAQTVTVSAGEDDDSVNDRATLTHRARGGGYDAVTGTVAVTVTDADKPVVTTAYLARFGRTVAEQALDGITGRLAAGRTPGLRGTLAGRALSFAPAAGGYGRGAGVSGSSAPDHHTPLAGATLAPGFDGAPGHAGAFGHAALAEPRPLTARETLLGSRFALTGASDATSGSLAVWGRASERRFDGAERGSALTLDGTVTTGLLGADYARDDWLVGLTLAQSTSEGRYTDAPRTGAVDASLTAALPYASVRAAPRLKLWGAAGLGSGEVTLKAPHAHSRADTDWAMAAGGVRGEVLDPAAGPARLTLTADALRARTASDKTAALAAVSAGVTRLRLGLEGRYRFTLDDAGELTPRLEAGVHRDGGDAETGSGVELGAGLAWGAPTLGLTLDVSGRTLRAHSDDDFEDRGLSAAFAFDPAPATQRGPSFSLRQDFGGRAQGGLDALFAATALEDRTDRDAPSHWAMESAWGLPVFGGRWTGSAHAGLELDVGVRDHSLGWRLAPEAANAPDLSFGVKATRRESDTAAPEHRVGVELLFHW